MPFALLPLLLYLALGCAQLHAGVRVSKAVLTACLGLGTGLFLLYTLGTVPFSITATASVVLAVPPLFAFYLRYVRKLRFTH